VQSNHCVTVPWSNFGIGLKPGHGIGLPARPSGIGLKPGHGIGLPARPSGIGHGRKISLARRPRRRHDPAPYASIALAGGHAIAIIMLRCLFVTLIVIAYLTGTQGVPAFGPAWAASVSHPGMQTVPKPTATAFVPGYITPTPYPQPSPVPHATIPADGLGHGTRPRRLWLPSIRR